MVLDDHVSSRLVAKLYWERNEYVLNTFHGVFEDFVSLAIPVREEAWRWRRGSRFFGKPFEAH